MTTTAVARAKPAEPMQDRLKTFRALFRAVVVAEPEVFRSPVHAPLAAHESVPEDDQVRVDVPPGATVLGSAVNVTLRVVSGVALPGSARQETNRTVTPAMRRPDRSSRAA
jgi:hypothetical protein